MTGFDLSDEGVAVTRKNAERAGVKVDAIVSTDDEFDYGDNRCGLIVFMYEPFPITTPAYVAKLNKSLRPEGLVVVESFSDPLAIFRG